MLHYRIKYTTGRRFEFYDIEASSFETAERLFRERFPDYLIVTITNRNRTLVMA